MAQRRSDSAVLSRPVKGLGAVGSGLDSAVLRCFLYPDNSERFLSHNFLSHLYSLMASVFRLIDPLYAWDPMGTQHVEERSLWLVLGSMPDSVREKFRVNNLNHSLTGVIEVDETGTPVRFGPLPLRSGIKYLTILLKFEYHRISHRREFQESKAATGGAITLIRSKTKCMVSPAVINPTMKGQGPVEAGSSSNAAQPLH